MPLETREPGFPADGLGARAPTAAQRERLLEAIATTVGERGWHRTTVKDVVACAGLSRRTLYDLYEDKEQCFLAACDHVTERVTRLMTTAYRRESSARAGVDAALGAFLRFCARNPAVACMYLVEISVAGSSGTARWQAHMDELASLASCALSRVSPALHAHAPTMAIGSVYTVARTRVLSGRARELPQLTPELSRTLWRLLGVE